MRLAIACVVLVATIAHAEDRKAAEALFRTGEQAFRKQQYAAAAENFEAAYKAAPIAEIAFSAAQAYRRQWFIERTPKPEIAKRAIELYRLYLDTVKSDGRRGDASDGIAELQRELDKLSPSVVALAAAPAKPQTRVAVGVVVPGEETKRALGDLTPLPAADAPTAKALLDGKPVDLFVPQEVSPGEHTAEVIADGYYPAKQSKRVVEGVNDVIEVPLVAKPARLTIRANGSVRVDGALGAVTRDVPAGTHVIEVTARGHVPISDRIELARGEAKTLDLALVPTPQRRAVKWVAIGSGALAGIAVVTGFVTLYYNGRMNTIDGDRINHGITEATFDEYHRVTKRRDLYRAATLLFGGAAVAGGGIALGMYWFDTPTVGVTGTF